MIENNSESAGPLEKLDINPVLAKAFQRAIRAEYGHNSAITIKQNWAYARFFVVCLQKIGLNQTVPLPATVMWDVHKFLQSSGFKRSTCQCRQNVIITLLRWCHRNIPNVVSRNATFDVPSFVREVVTYKNIISEESVKKILSLCYSEIEEIEDRLIRKKHLLLDAVNSSDPEYKKLIEDLLMVGNGRIPFQRELRGHRLQLHRRIERFGGLTKIRSQLYFMHEDVLPFYVAIIVQTAGNPMAVRDANTDCIEPHPLRTDLEFLNWEKRRSASEQRVDFPVDKEWSAPNLVRKMLNLNDSLRSISHAEYRDRIFISLSEKSDVPTVPSVQTLHNALALFLKKNNLDNFDFKDFRRSSAHAHRVAGGTIEVARKKLNHRNASTTYKYYSGREDASQFNDEAIVRFQGSLIRQSTELMNVADDASTLPVGWEEAPKPAETVFGFQCADPFAGINKLAQKGSRCVHFSQCSTCRGAIIPVDDPIVIAKVLSSQMALKDAKVRAERTGWELRFKKIYASTLDVIEREILPFVHPEVLRVASNHINKSLVPFLE